MTELNVESFKAYDIRGEVPEVLDNSIAYAIGRAFELLDPEIGGRWARYKALRNRNI